MREEKIEYKLNFFSKTNTKFFKRLSIFFLIFIVFFILFRNFIKIDNFSYILILVGLIGIFIEFFNEMLDHKYNRPNTLEDKKLIDNWSLGHIIRDLFIFLLFYYFTTNYLFSSICLLILVSIYEGLETIWDNESKKNKFSDIIMGFVGIFIGYFIITYLI